MSTTFQYVIGKRDVPDQILKDRHGRSFRKLEGSESGWVFLEADSSLVEPLENLALAWSTMADTPVLGTSVETSDYAYVVAAESGGIAARFLINPQGAEDLREGVIALGKCQEVGRNWRSIGARGLAEWSKSAPTQVDYQTVLKLVRKRWLFPEDGVDELLRLVRLSPPRLVAQGDFDEVSSLLDSGKVWDFGRPPVDRSRERYVMGYGEGFIGIWDREQPGPPLRRFHYSREGWEDAYREWGRMIRRWPWRLELEWQLWHRSPSAKRIAGEIARRLKSRRGSE